jgi:hypothetical protein
VKRCSHRLWKNGKCGSVTCVKTSTMVRKIPKELHKKTHPAYAGISLATVIYSKAFELKVR